MATTPSLVLSFQLDHANSDARGTIRLVVSTATPSPRAEFYQLYQGETSVQSGQAPFFNITEPGLYTVIATDAHGGTQQSQPISITEEMVAYARSKAAAPTPQDATPAAGAPTRTSASSSSTAGCALVFLVVAGVLGGGGYFLYQKYLAAPSNAEIMVPVEHTAPRPAPPAVAPIPASLTPAEAEDRVRADGNRYSFLRDGAIPAAAKLHAVPPAQYQRPDGAVDGFIDRTAKRLYAYSQVGVFVLLPSVSDPPAAAAPASHTIPSSLTPAEAEARVRADGNRYAFVVDVRLPAVAKIHGVPPTKYQRPDGAVDGFIDRTTKQLYAYSQGGLFILLPRDP